MPLQHISYYVRWPDASNIGWPPGSYGPPYLPQGNQPSMRSRSVMGKGKLCHCSVPCLVITTCILEQATCVGGANHRTQYVHINMVIDFTLVEPRESAQHCGQHSFVPGLFLRYIWSLLFISFLCHYPSIQHTL